MNNNPKILIVDDNPSSLDMLFNFFDEEGFTVFVAQDGPDALQRVSKADPDLILLDIMMPDMDGLETCRRLKEDPQTAQIPIIFITALSDIKNKTRGFAMGGVDYVTKPFHQAEVLARVKTHLKLRRAEQALQTQNEQLQAEIAQRKRVETEREKLIVQLEASLDKVKQLSGLLPICSHCKRIRDDEGYWQDVAVYIRKHSEADFTHGLCPTCIVELYPDLDLSEEELAPDL